MSPGFCNYAQNNYEWRGVPPSPCTGDSRPEPRLLILLCVGEDRHFQVALERELALAPNSSDLLAREPLQKVAIISLIGLPMLLIMCQSTKPNPLTTFTGQRVLTDAWIEADRVLQSLRSCEYDEAMVKRLAMMTTYLVSVDLPCLGPNYM